MSKTFFDTSQQEQIQTTLSKIHTQFCTASRTEFDDKFALVMTRLHGNFARGLTWGPNHTKTGDGVIPSSFQFSCSPESPVYAGIFPRDELLGGTFCIPLEPAKFQLANGRSLQRDELATDSAQANLMRLRFDGIEFAGVFCEFRGAAEKLYCVVRACSKEISHRAFAMIEEAQPRNVEDVDRFARLRIAEYEQYQKQKSNPSADFVISMAQKQSTERVGKADFVTWRQLFFSQKWLRLEEEQRHHCAEIAAAVLESCGVKWIGGTAAELLKNDAAWFDSYNTIEKVDSDDSESDMVFLRNMASNRRLSRHGYILSAAAEDGLLLLQTKVGEAVQTPEPSMSPLVGVPIGMGHANEERLCAETAPHMNASRSVFWLASAKKHRLLHRTNYIERNQQYEALVHLNPHYVQHLIPVRVLVQSPDY